MNQNLLNDSVLNDSESNLFNDSVDPVYKTGFVSKKALWDKLIIKTICGKRSTIYLTMLLGNAALSEWFFHESWHNSMNQWLAVIKNNDLLSVSESIIWLQEIGIDYFYDILMVILCSLWSLKTLLLTYCNCTDKSVQKIIFKIGIFMFC